MTRMPFTKMHGLGNDFVVLDGRDRLPGLGPSEVRAIADRRTGIGCDQLIVIEPPRDNRAGAFMRIHNADGGEVDACGNATRCIASRLMAESGTGQAIIETGAGLLTVTAEDDGLFCVDMGEARLNWRDIPLSEDKDTLHLGFEVGPLRDGVAVNVGNPHVVFFVDAVDAVPLETSGPEIENHALFPKRTNVEVVQVLSPGDIRVRVWERGVGVTQACGTGACAAVVAASSLGLTDRGADVQLDGGTLRIEWLDNGHVRMTGPVATSFEGIFDDGLTVVTHECA